MLYRRDAEETLPTTRELGITFVAYSPLGRGLLTGKPESHLTMSEKDNRRRHPRFAAENLAQNIALAQKVEAIAKRKGCTIGQLGWLGFSRKAMTSFPFPGTKRKERLIENIGALSVNLSQSDIAEIADAIPVGAAAGTRYPPRRPDGKRLPLKRALMPNNMQTATLGRGGPVVGALGPRLHGDVSRHLRTGRRCRRHRHDP